MSQASFSGVLWPKASGDYKRHRVFQTHAPPGRPCRVSAAPSEQAQGRRVGVAMDTAQSFCDEVPRAPSLIGVLGFPRSTRSQAERIGQHWLGMAAFLPWRPVPQSKGLSQARVCPCAPCSASGVSPCREWRVSSPARHAAGGRQVPDCRTFRHGRQTASRPIHSVRICPIQNPGSIDLVTSMVWGKFHPFKIRTSMRRTQTFPDPHFADWAR